MASLEYIDLGRVAYGPALELQRKLLRRVQQAQSELAYLILVEHDPPVITLGVGADERNVLASGQELAAAGVELHKTRRGGDVTYHGPGQLVGYPIIQLTRHGKSLRKYVRDLEEVLIGVVAELGIKGQRKAGLPGVWVGGDKLAAIGVAVSRWVSYHGFALNVRPKMEHFKLIVPCGLTAAAPTSLAKLLGRAVEPEEIKPLILRQMVDVFGLSGWATSTEKHLVQ